MSSWKSKVLSKTDNRTAKVSLIRKPNSRKYIEIEFDNMDVGQILAEDWKYKEGDEVTYCLETKEWSDGNDSFTTVNIIEFKEEPIEKKIEIKPIKFLESYHPRKILFIDIKCVRNSKTLTNNTPEFESWKYKRRKDNETDLKSLQESYKTSAALYAEFGKVVCVTIGRINKSNQIELKSYYSHNEIDVLEKVSEVIEYFCSRGFAIGGFGIKGYDIPFLMRRMLINRVPIPSVLDVAGAKPWEIKVVDTSELWRSTGFYSASLINVTTALGLPSPKEFMDGSEVSDKYYQSKKNLEKIVEYCEKDIVSAINITLSMFGVDFITEIISKTFTNGTKTEEK